MKQYILTLALLLLMLGSARSAPFLPGIYVDFLGGGSRDIYLDAYNETSGGITFGRVNQITGGVYDYFYGPVTNHANGVVRGTVRRGRNESRGWLRGRVSADGLTITGRFIFISVRDNKKFRRVHRVVLSRIDSAFAPDAEASTVPQ